MAPESLRLNTFGGLWLQTEAGPLAGAASQRRRLALLALVAAAGPGGVSRDKVIGYLWPESDDEHARHALAQLVYGMRRTLKRPLIAGDATFRLDPSSLTSDISDFCHATTSPSQLAGLYGGPFLDGFHLADAPEFDRWAEGQRARTTAMACGAFETLARGASARGDHSEAVDAWRRRIAAGPSDIGPTLSLMECLARVGDRAAAVRHAQLYEKLIRTEFEIEPDPAVSALAERLRHEPYSARITSSAAVPEGSLTEPMAAERVQTEAAFAGLTDARARSPLEAASRHPAAPVGGSVAAPARSYWKSREARFWSAAAAVAVAIAAVIAYALHDTRPVAATRLYNEGLRVLNHGDAASASGLFDAALVEDTAFSMAAYFGWRAATLAGSRREADAYRTMLLVSQRGSVRDRLFITGTVAAEFMDTSARAMAESLTTLYPNDPDAHLLLGSVYSVMGNYAGTVTEAKLVRRMNSRTSVDSAGCPTCDAYHMEIGAMIALDSLRGAEELARVWTAMTPRSPAAHARLADVLERAGRLSEAQAAIEATDSISPLPRRADPRPNIYDIRAGRFHEVDARLRASLQGTPDEAGLARWLLMISLRNQGRFADALSLAQESGYSDVLPQHALGHALFESGDAAAAVVNFDASLARTGLHRSDGMRARARVWHLAHLATSLAAEGDTARLRVVADDLQRTGVRSLYSRDRLLHHYARGLLLKAEGKSQLAIAEFTKSISSLTEGFTREHFELGSLLIGAGKYAEAIAVLGAALRGSIDASNYYVTRTELHELLAQSYEGAGQHRDASAQFLLVSKAWTNGDPAFETRGRRAGLRAARLSMRN